MRSYIELLEDVEQNGEQHDDRTGTGTSRVLGRHFRHNLSAGFPLLTTKKMFMRGITEELRWFLRGSTNVRELQALQVKIWDEWENENGDAGPIYGHQWRNFGKSRVIKSGPGIDQIARLMHDIKNNPNSRRMIVTAWNPVDVDLCELPPCHVMFQVFVQNGKLSTVVYQRSGDLFLGVPYNIASYALLTHLLAISTNLEVGDLIINFGDLHVYNNHQQQVAKQRKREPFALPQLTLNPRLKGYGMQSMMHFKYSDVELAKYQFHPTIKGAVSV